MSVVTKWIALGALGLAAGACREKPKPPSDLASTERPGPSASAPSAAAVEKLRVVPAPPVASVDLAKAPGPAPSASAVPRELRESAVLTLLSDTSVIRQTPLLDLEPGREFDWELRDKVAPRISVPNGKIRLFEVKVDGALAVEIVQRFIRRNIARLRDCYADGLATNQTLEGRVKIGFTIAPDGKVATARNGASTIQDTEVTDCVTNALRQSEFPTADAPTHVALSVGLALP